MLYGPYRYLNGYNHGTGKPLFRGRGHPSKWSTTGRNTP